MRHALALPLLLASSGAMAIGSTTCHIHPPGSTPDKPVNIVGPFDSVRTCEEERARRFGPEAYCHCSADFTPDWRSLEPGSQSPGGPSG